MCICVCVYVCVCKDSTSTSLLGILNKLQRWVLDYLVYPETSRGRPSKGMAAWRTRLPTQNLIAQPILELLSDHRTHTYTPNTENTLLVWCAMCNMVFYKLNSTQLHDHWHFFFFMPLLIACKCETCVVKHPHTPDSFDVVFILFWLHKYWILFIFIS